MSSTSAALLGRQEPRVCNVPQYVWSQADDACFLAASYGLTADPWQADVLTSWLGEDEAGYWSASRCGLAVPRQNGKNGALEIRELYGMVALGEKFLHTAHEVKTARKAFKRLKHFFGEKADDPKARFPELNALVDEVRSTNGQEAIVLKNGGSVEFVARSSGSGRGFTVDVLVLDEAQHLTDEELEALLFTISAAPLGNPQTIFMGTPPGPKVPGEVFTRIRRTGVAGTNPSLAWHEWSVPDDALIDIWDEALWALTNPALGRRMRLKTIRDELPPFMSEDGFARERLGRWSSTAASAVISPPTWKRGAVTSAPPTGRISYGVKFSPDGALMGLAVARRPEAGPIHVEVIAVKTTAEGTAWAVDWLEQRWREAAQIVVDGKSNAGAFVTALRAAGIPASVIIVPTADQAVSAHAMILEALRTEQLTHADQPGLNDAVRNAGRRPIGTNGGWGWKPINEDTPVIALDAVTLAHYGAKTTKRHPGRKQVLL